MIYTGFNVHVLAKLLCPHLDGTRSPLVKGVTNSTGGSPRALKHYQIRKLIEPIHLWKLDSVTEPNAPVADKYLSLPIAFTN